MFGIFKRKTKSKLGSIKIDVGAHVKLCGECEKYNKGIELYQMFEQGECCNFLIRYDKKNQTFLINEDMLMHAIQLVNPLQRQRKLKIVSQEEWMKHE